MSLFDRMGTRALFRTTVIILSSVAALSVSGCASGPRRMWTGFGPSPAPSGQPSMQGPTPVITPGTPPDQPIKSGPVILPRDAFRRPPGQSHFRQGKLSGFGTAAPQAIDPQTIPSRMSPPVIRYVPPPAALSGGIEIVPNSHPVESMSSQTFFDIMPNESAAPDTDAVDMLPSPTGKRFEELPPPPE